MTRTNELHIRAPFTGMEEREAFQGHTSCSLAVNVDFSRGDIRPRPGMTAVLSAASGAVLYGRMGAIEHAGEDYILRVGQSSLGGTPNAVSYDVSTPNGSLIGSGNLSGEFYPDKSWSCSIVPSALANGPVLLVYTPASCWVFDPSVSTTTLRKMDVSTDAIQLLSSNGSYWASVPCGPLAVEHNGRVYFGGWESKSVRFDGDMPSGQDDVPEHMVKEDRGEAEFPSSIIAFSDPNDPAGVWAPSFLQYGSGERYMGAVAIGEVLYCFTDQAIYAQTGDSLTGLNVAEVYRGSACAAAQTLIAAGGVAYYLGQDGIYAFDGGKPQKLSGGIDWFFRDGWQDPVPAEIAGVFESFPWLFNKGFVKHARVAHLEDYRQLWFSMPIAGERGVGLVYSYDVGAWSVYVEGDDYDLFGGHVYHKGTHYFSHHAGTWKLGGEDSFRGGFPVVYLSRRYGLESINVKDWQRLWVDIMTCGKTEDYSEVPEFFMVGSRAALDSEDGGSDNSDRQEQDVSFLGHPESEQNTYWFNTAEYNTAQWTQNGWTWMELREENIRDRWIQFGFHDYPSSDDRPPVTRIRGFCLEFNDIGRR